MSIASPGSRSLSGAPPHSNAEPYVGLARWHETGNVSGMSTVAEFQSALAKLPVEAQCEIAAWLESRLWPETPAMLAAIDEAEISLVEDGGVPVEDVRKNLRQWITG